MRPARPTRSEDSSLTFPRQSPGTTPRRQEPRRPLRSQHRLCHRPGDTQARPRQRAPSARRSCSIDPENRQSVSCACKPPKPPTTWESRAAIPLAARSVAGGAARLQITFCLRFTVRTAFTSFGGLYEGWGEMTDDPVLEAIDNLVAVLDVICKQKAEITDRALLIRNRRESGDLYSVIVPEEIPPLIVERARDSFNELIDAAGRLQRAEARALHAEGMSMDRIGSLFGVTRQRIADFVRDATLDAR